MVREKELRNIRIGKRGKSREQGWMMENSVFSVPEQLILVNSTELGHLEVNACVMNIKSHHQCSADTMIPHGNL